MSPIASSPPLRWMLVLSLLVGSLAAVGATAHLAPRRHTRCTPAITERPAPPPQIRPPSNLYVPANLPRACREYVIELDAMARCNELPVESRHAIAQAVQTSLEAWVQLPAEVMPQLGDACRAASDAIKQASAQICPQR